MREKTKFIMFFESFEIGYIELQVIFGHEQIDDVKISLINDSDKATI